MSLLPIVERELRVASRRSATYWIRFFLVVGLFLLWLIMIAMMPNVAAVSRGSLVFGFVAGVLYLFSLFAGVFFTADCLCEERRDGTLGLLFLTDLEGYDVVFGKLIATSVNGIYGLVATLPLLAYSVLLGGVTGFELVRIAGALGVTLLFSLTAGIVISSVSKDSRQAMGISMAFLLVITFGPQLIAGLLATLFRGFHPILISAVSPATLFSYSFERAYQFRGGAAHYWTALAFLTFATMGGIFYAGRKVSLVWHDDREQSEDVDRSRLYPKKLVRTDGYHKSRLNDSPFLWLATRDGAVSVQALRAVLALAILSMGASLLTFSSNPARNFTAFNVALFLGYGCHQALKWFVALESSRRLSEDKRTGALELLLVTPLEIEEIISGQRQALFVNFRASIFLALTVNIVLMAMAIANSIHLPTQYVVIMCELCLGGIALLFLDFNALRWVGMWMALVSPRHQRAVLGTIARVIIFPWVAVLFLGLLTMGGVALDPDVMVVLCFAWLGFAAMIEATFISRAKIGLMEAMRKISSDPTISTLNPPPLQIREELA